MSRVAPFAPPTMPPPSAGTGAGGTPQPNDDPRGAPAIEFRRVGFTYGRGTGNRSRPCRPTGAVPPGPDVSRDPGAGLEPPDLPRATLSDIDLIVPRGEVFVLLGPNGAGKTTLLRLLLGLAAPTTGEIRLFGRPAAEPASRHRVGYLPEQPLRFPHLDAPGFLRFFAELGDLPPATIEDRISHWLARTGIAAHGSKPLPEYSKGMLQRLNLCRALLADPDLVILDEPIVGLDPLGQQLVRELVEEQRAAGRTVLINTHASSFARQVADRIGLIMAGRLVAVVPHPRQLRPHPPYLAVALGIERERDAAAIHVSGLTVLGRTAVESAPAGAGVAGATDVGAFAPATAGPDRTDIATGRPDFLTLVRLDDEPARQRFLQLAGEAGWQVVELASNHDPIERLFLHHAAPLSAVEKAR